MAALRAGGSAIGLSATDALGRAVVGDAGSLADGSEIRTNLRQVPNKMSGSFRACRLLMGSSGHAPAPASAGRGAPRFG
jgi:hypothetical protein